MDAMGQVRKDMHVVDAAGEDVGTVEDLKLGDPEATTAQGQETGSQAGPLAAVAGAFGAGEPDVPPQQAERMLRVGYLKVEGKGLLSKDLYVAGDQVERVSDDTVHLTVRREDLTAEA